ncbi:MAG: hypothetical protein J7K59_05730, partial [Candidatus Korarchaeota archaeon]|nr:hypothetical protein [Candidatus Korarchaeota archaeon]
MSSQRIKLDIPHQTNEIDICKLFSFQDRLFTVLSSKNNLFVFSDGKLVLNKSFNEYIKDFHLSNNEIIWVAAGHRFLALNLTGEIIGWTTLNAISKKILPWDDKFIIIAPNRLYFIDKSLKQEYESVALQSLILDGTIWNNHIVLSNDQAQLLMFDGHGNMISSVNIGRLITKLIPSKNKLIMHDTYEILVYDPNKRKVEKVIDGEILKTFVFDYDCDGIDEIIFLDNNYNLNVLLDDRIQPIIRLARNRVVNIQFIDVNKDGLIELIISNKKGEIAINRMPDYYYYHYYISIKDYKNATNILLSNKKLYKQIELLEGINPNLLIYLYLENVKDITLDQVFPDINKVTDKELIRKLFTRAFKENQKLILTNLTKLNNIQLITLFELKPTLLLEYYPKVKRKLNSNERKAVLANIAGLSVSSKKKLLNEILSLEDIILAWESLTSEDRKLLSENIWRRLLERNPKLAVSSPFSDIRFLAYLKLQELDHALNLCLENEGLIAKYENIMPIELLVNLIKRKRWITALEKVFPKIKNDPDTIKFIAGRKPEFIAENISDINVDEKNLIEILNILEKKGVMSTEIIEKIRKPYLVLKMNIQPSRMLELIKPFVEHLNDDQYYTLWGLDPTLMGSNLSFTRLFKIAINKKARDLIFWCTRTRPDFIIFKFGKIPQKFRADVLLRLYKQNKLNKILEHIKFEELQKYDAFFRILCIKHPKIVIANAKKLTFENRIKALDLIDESYVKPFLLKFNPKEALKILLKTQKDEDLMDESIIKENLENLKKLPEEFFEDATKIAPRVILNMDVSNYYKFKASLQIDDYKLAAQFCVSEYNRAEDPKNPTTNFIKILEIIQSLHMSRILKILYFVWEININAGLTIFRTIKHEKRSRVLLKTAKVMKDYYVIPITENIVTKAILIPKKYRLLKDIKTLKKIIEKGKKKSIIIHGVEVNLYFSKNSLLI